MYGLKIVGVPEQKSGGVESAVWLIDSDRGKFYFKIYGLHQGNIERIQDEINLYEYLRSYGISVPEVLSSVDTQKVVNLEHNGSQYNVIVMKYEELREGKPSELTDEEVTRLGKMIGIMNKAMKDYPPDNKSIFDGKLQVIPTDANDVFINSFNYRFFSEEEKDWIRSINNKVEVYLRENAVDEEPLSRVVIHGDLALEHAQFLPSGEIYFFDFADRWYGPIAWDLAVMTENLYRGEDISFERWEYLRNLFFEGYLSENNLTPEDIKAIKPMMLSHLVGAAKWLNEVSNTEQCDVDTKGNRRRYKLAEYLLPHE